jgi:hypothetical protein
MTPATDFIATSYFCVVHNQEKVKPVLAMQWSSFPPPEQKVMGSNPRQDIRFFDKKLPPYTLTGFDLKTRSSSLLCDRWRRYH